KGTIMRAQANTRITFLLIAAAVLTGAAACVGAASRQASSQADVAVDVGMHAGYPDWTLISVPRAGGEREHLRAIPGNDVAVKAYRQGRLPFADGGVIARIAWSYVADEENNKSFGRRQSFVAGTPKNGVQFMVKDSKKYASTGGWGFEHFDDGKLAGEAVLKKCFACHATLPERDLVFTRYAR